MITLSNEFHGTIYTTTKREGDRVSLRTERRMRRALCGASACLCSMAGGLSSRVGRGDYYLQEHDDPCTGRPKFYTLERFDW